MNYKDIKQLFAQHSGRWDLVNPTTLEDHGAGVFIRAGQRYLDRRVDVGSALAEAEFTLAASAYSLTLPIRAVQSVHIIESTGVRPLYRLATIEEARRNYSTADFSSLTAGTPQAYFVGIPRSSANNPADDIKKKIIILPPTSAQVTIKVRGLLYQKELREDNDTNFWTLSEPLMLVQAAMLQVEMLYRNTEGINDLSLALEQMIFNLELDTIEEQSFGQDRVLSPWRYIDELEIPYGPSQNEI